MISARGRPRSREIGDRIVAATLALLAESGYSALTLEGIAKAAGVARPTIYRRWPGKAALVADVLADSIPPLVLPDTGDAVGDLMTAAVEFIVTMSESPYGPVAYGLLAEAHHDDELANHLQRAYVAARVVSVLGLIERAQHAGRLAGDIPPDVVRDIVFGPLIFRWLVAGQPMDRCNARRLVEIAFRAVESR